MRESIEQERSPFKTKIRITFSARYLFLIVPVALACVAALYAHFQVQQAGDDYTGPLALLDRLFDLLLALVLTGAAFCVGRRIAGACSLSFDNVAEEFSFSVILGTGTIALGVLGLGLAGLLSLTPVALLLVALLVISYREAPRLVGVARGMLSGAMRTKASLIITLLFILLSAVMMLRAATPPSDFDEAIYHLSVTNAFVKRGEVYPIIDNAAGNMPLLIQMIYAICLMAKADIAARVFSLILALTCGVALYGFCARFLSRRAGVVTMFGFFAAGIVVEVAVTTRIDVSLSCILFLSTYAMILYFESTRRGWLYASAILAGFAFGVKYTAGVWILLLGAMFLLEHFFRKSQPLLTVLKRGFLYAAIVLAVASPWLIKNLVWFHNPLYPFLTGEVAAFTPGRPSYFTPEDDLKLEAHFERARRSMPSLVAERDQELSKAVSERAIKRPPHFWEYFTKPDAYNYPEAYHYPNYLFLFAPLLVFAPRSRWLLWLAILAIAYFILITQMAWYSRYLLPMYPALTLVSAYALTESANRVDWKKRLRPRTHLATVVPAVALSVAVGSIALLSLMLTVNGNSLEFLKGNLSRRGFMSRLFYYPPIDFINQELPKNSRVMMLGAQMSYGIKGDYIADISMDTTEWRRLLIRNDSLAAVHNDLKQRGVTHILVSYGIFPWAASRAGNDSPLSFGSTSTIGQQYRVQLRNWATLDQYSSNFLEQVYSDKFGFVLYRLR
jgi:4-amino-4-deoxy-L-arabinose transferase-like glycosyltransferase